MPAILIQPDHLSLPGPGIYRYDASGTDIRLGLINLVDMLRQYLPEVDPESYQTLKARAFAVDDLRDDFLSGDEIRQVNSFKALKKQVEWIGGRYALKTVVAKTLPAAGCARWISVAYEPRGAPYLANRPEISISISHAGEYALAGVSGNLDTRIGLDIERIGRQGLGEVMKVAFTDREIKAARDSPEEACRIWTRKEAYLKFVKTGFRESLKRVDVSGGTIVHGGVPVAGLGTKTLRIGHRYLLSMVYRDMRKG
ncbi:MAG: 4'-phosphopantetheinyl transferase superfamily protein [Desulfobacterales bacterium]|nr:4'-phosphopantetheinyl transferase superfamily protein [Desulfobacterales bacterium]